MTGTYLGIRQPAVPSLLNRLGHMLVGLSSSIVTPWNYAETKTQLVSSQQASVLFTDIVGFSELMKVRPLEEFVGSLNRYFGGLSRCVHRHRGQVDKFIGDGMMAVFESPDDAVDAAYAIQREVVGYNSRQLGQARCAFPTRIVVDTGLVVKTSIGLHRDRDWTVMGPVVNTASHLAKTLPPDRVFITHSTGCRLTNRSGLCLTKTLAADGDGSRLAIYEVQSL